MMEENGIKPWYPETRAALATLVVEYGQYTG